MWHPLDPPSGAHLGIKALFWAFGAKWAKLGWFQANTMC